MGNKINVFKPSGGHQTWDNGFPPTPIPTNQYPYQVIYQDRDPIHYMWSIAICAVPLVTYRGTFGSLRFKPSVDGVVMMYAFVYTDSQYSYIPSAWGIMTDISVAEGQITQCNHNITGTDPMSATIEQREDYDAFPTPFRVRNLRHFDTEFLQARAIKVKNTDGSWGRCNI